MLTYCAYRGCTQRKQPCSRTTFFTIPKDHRRPIWIENSGNPMLKNIPQNSVRIICEHHFDSKDLKRQFNRTILRKSAIPFKYDSAKTSLSYKLKYITEGEVNEDALLENNMDMSTESDPTSNTDFNEEDQSSKIDTSDNYFDINYQTSPKIPEENIESITYEDTLDQDYITIIEQDSSENYDSNEFNEKEDDMAKTCRDTSESHEEMHLIEEIEQNLCQVKTKSQIKTYADMKELKRKRNLQNGEIILNSKKAKQQSYKNGNNSSSDDERSDYSEDKHFALSLVGYFRRLSHKTKSKAKLNILDYLINLEVQESEFL